MKLTENMAVKTAAVFLVFFASIGMAVGGVGGVCANEMGLYDPGSDAAYYFSSVVYEEAAEDYARQLIWSMAEDTDAFVLSCLYGGEYAITSTNIAFTVSASDGEQIVSNYGGEDCAVASRREFYFFFEDTGTLHMSETPMLTDSGEGFVLEMAMLSSPSAADRFSVTRSLYEYLASHRIFILWQAVLSALILAVSTVYLCCASGHRAGREEITLSPVDRLPYDIYLAVAAALAMIILMFMLSAVERFEIFNARNAHYIFVALCILAGLFSLVCLAVLLTSAVRLKCGGLWRNTVVYRLLRWMGVLIRALCRGVKRAVGAVAVQWRVFVFTSAFFLLTFVMGVQCYYNEGMVFLLMLADMAAVLVCCLYANDLKRVIKGSGAIASGDVDYKIDESRMRGDLKTLAGDLNSIAGGLGIAVEQRIRSERLKTELITNVSHDIKTPLTSIINYVDLLKKEPLEGKAVEYADILEKHANRLKKLTLDLIEASKAATGNIQVELVPINICEVVNQAAGEYDERLERGMITPVVAMPETPRYIMADSQLIWRVIDNLLGNAAKYSQEGTRLYISVFDRSGEVILQMKNISRERLNIDPQELTERFVRGDSSRHTDGSGLGLNIAKNLTELQHGRFNIDIDGDLFKAELAFTGLSNFPTEEDAP